MALSDLLDRREDTWWQRFIRAPTPTLARYLYARRQHVLARYALPENDALRNRIVCISDTHNSQPYLPPGDVLIHVGDLTQSGTVDELQKQLDWINKQSHKHKMIIAGNHDIVLDDQKAAEFGFSPNGRKALRFGSITYLQRSATNLQLSHGRKMTVFGHPSTRKQGNWAFQHERGTNVFYNQTPDAVDILVTHSPPRSHLDEGGLGDEFLLRELWCVRPRLPVFGHIHAGSGQDVLVYDRFEQLYQQVCAGNAGLIALCSMSLLLLRMMATGYGLDAQKTILVNAAAVGGLRDERKCEGVVVRL